MNKYHVCIIPPNGTGVYIAVGGVNNQIVYFGHGFLEEEKISIINMLFISTEIFVYHSINNTIH